MKVTNYRKFRPHTSNRFLKKSKYVYIKIKATHLKLGTGKPWAGHNRVILNKLLAVKLRESRTIENFGLTLPTGSKKNINLSNSIELTESWELENPEQDIAD